MYVEPLQCKLSFKTQLGTGSLQTNIFSEILLFEVDEIQDEEFESGYIPPLQRCYISCVKKGETISNSAYSAEYRITSHLYYMISASIKQ